MQLKLFLTKHFIQTTAVEFDKKVITNSPIKSHLPNLIRKMRFYFLSQGYHLLQQHGCLHKFKVKSPHNKEI